MLEDGAKSFVLDKDGCWKGVTSYWLKPGHFVLAKLCYRPRFLVGAYRPRMFFLAVSAECLGDGGGCVADT